MVDPTLSNPTMRQSKTSKLTTTTNKGKEKQKKIRDMKKKAQKGPIREVPTALVSFYFSTLASFLSMCHFPLSLSLYIYRENGDMCVSEWPAFALTSTTHPQWRMLTVQSEHTFFVVKFQLKVTKKGKASWGGFCGAL